MSVRHSDDDEAFLAIILTVVHALDSECIFKDRLRQFEARAVGWQIGFGLAACLREIANGMLRGGFETPRDFNSVCVSLLKEHTIIAATKTEGGAWRLKLFDVAGTGGQVAVYAIEDLRRRFAINCAQIIAGLR
jgi:hypothetical protein